MHPIHKNSLVIVGHTDLVASDVDWRRVAGEKNVFTRRHLPTLRKGGVSAICDHIGGDAPYGYLPATQYRTTHIQRLMRAIDATLNDVAESDDFVVACTADDIEAASEQGKIAVIICIEGGAAFEGELSYLRNFYRLGLRCLGLTHDLRNEIGDGVRERNAGGLTHFGVEVVKECNRLGMLIDVSHLSDRGTEDVLNLSKHPITASHSNARALCGHPRNLPDHFIRDIAKAGGVIGFHGLDGLVSDQPEPTIDHIVRHIAHIAEVGGVDCIAIGPDLMENWEPKVFTSVYEWSSTISSLPVQRYNWTYPKGFQSLAELPNLTDALLKAGFSEEDLVKFLGGNLMRLFRAVW